jgi:thymidylate synthase ThyX
MKANYIPTRPPNEISLEEIKELQEVIAVLDTAEREGLNLQLNFLKDLIRRDTTKLKSISAKCQEGVAPEKLAACLARYSRNNEGIKTILRTYGHQSADQIFKFVDYGHASIGGLTGGVAITVDRISMLLAYKLFEFAQMADGQESSTRYITIERSSLANPEEIGIPKDLTQMWQETTDLGFQLYKQVSGALNDSVEKAPGKARIPAKALGNRKVKERMLKNYALDRSRYFLPLACLTNVAIIATARIWADIIKLIESLQWPEALELARNLRNELAKAAPNLIRHSHADKASISFVQELQQAGQRVAATTKGWAAIKTTCNCRVEVFNPQTTFNKVGTIQSALTGHANRYHHTGAAVKRQTVQVEWDRIAIAELRDLNRHRTGFRFSDFAPQGFYLPEETQAITPEGELAKFQNLYENLVRELSRKAQCGLHAYGFFLGSQVAFEHTQQADKFLYEVELRTGLGAHFRYAQHLKQAAELYFQQVPEARDFIQIGEAEPE